VSDLEFLFHPRSIAIVGTPSDPRDMSGGAAFLHALTRSGYKGDIWPVNPKAGEITGLKSYPDLMSLPQTPDYVICCLPASLTARLIRDCAAKGVRAVSIFTAGFSEASSEGRKLEAELVGLARQGGVRLIGPNCIGHILSQHRFVVLLGVQQGVWQCWFSLPKRREFYSLSTHGRRPRYWLQ
jgi:acyl-CoA synthetase (NDP forming)